MVNLLLPGVAAAQTDLCAAANEVSIHCGRTPMSVFAKDGRLYSVFVQGEYVYFAASRDQGHSFGKPVAINNTSEPIYSNGENRPKISMGRNGLILVSWSKITEGRFNGEVRFTRSLDAGKSFEPVRTINDDGLLTTHRFETIQIDDAGNIYLTWIDKRDLVAARTQGDPSEGAAVYYSVSVDDGETFMANRLVANHSCECCRIASAPANEGIGIFWRHIFKNSVRDHAFAGLTPEGVLTPLQRATTDNWNLQVCPHHGPAMVSVADGNLRDFHLTWFTNASDRAGVFYGRRNAGNEDPLDVKAISTAPSASHPHLVADGNHLWLAWKEFNGAETEIRLLVSENAGRDWRPERTVAATNGRSDHPLLLKWQSKIFLSWFTGREGYRLIQLDEAS